MNLDLSLRGAIRISVLSEVDLIVRREAYGETKLMLILALTRELITKPTLP